MNLPNSIHSGLWPYGHCQGIAADVQNGFMYYAFTTALVKTDFSGQFIGSVTGLLGHLGCIVFHEGRVYGSLEYKNDEIGRGILRTLGREDQLENAFYIAIFDVDRIDRPDMDACSTQVMQAVYLPEVVADFTSGRFGCSGIDGTAVGPLFGQPKGSKPYLYVAYGIYSDLARDDNDHQVLLRYDLEELLALRQPLKQHHMHHSGPDKPLEKLFLFTGNTTYGVQNLEYDPFTGDWLLAVYPGEKPQFPNYSLFVADGSRAPEDGRIFLKPIGECQNGIYGFRFPHGSTGLCALGDGQYLISHHGREDKLHFSTAWLYRWDGTSPFALIDE